jgi:hypothetical protein
MRKEQMRVRLLIACLVVLGVAVVGWAVGTRPEDEQLGELYEEYLAFVQGQAVLTHMGLALGVEAPQTGDVVFSGQITVVVLVSEPQLYEATETYAAMQSLLREWDGIPGVEVVAILPCEEGTEIPLGWPLEIETVYDPSNRLRGQYNMPLPENPAFTFFFVGREGRIASRWLGRPVFGEAWDSFLRAAGSLAEEGSSFRAGVVQNHPDNTLGKHADAYTFSGLRGEEVVLPGDEVDVLLFLPSVPEVARLPCVAVFQRLAETYADRADFYVVMPDVSAEGLLASQEAVRLGLIETAVAPIAEALYGPLPDDPEGIRTWLERVWSASTLPMLSAAEQEIGIRVLRDIGSRALFGWGLSLMGYETLAVLDADGTMVASEIVVEKFEPLYEYWIGLVVGEQ